MKKVLFVIPLAMALFACGNQESTPKEETNKPVTTQQDTNTQSNHTWKVDNRLSEPTEDTHCSMCNMKVYTKDEEMGVFAAQAIKPDGSVVFYDDIGCLLNDEYVNQTKNEKFVRDYNTLNWFDVEKATIVKTDLKSPMNWGYIFFKYKEDAEAYLEAHPTANITPIAQVREEGIERHKNKEAHSGSHNHSSESQDMEGKMNMDMEEDNSSEGHDD